MNRLLTALAVVSVLTLVAGPLALAQDEIIYIDRTGKVPAEKKVLGTVQVETPSQIVFKPSRGTGTKEVKVADLVDIAYHIPGGGIDYSNARSSEKTSTDAPNDKERETALETALKRYTDILPKAQEAKAKRHIEFKIARLTARLADKDASQRDPAIEKLMKFKQQHSDGWQITQAAKLLARLQLAKNDTAGAEKTYTDLAATPNLAADTKLDCDLQIAHIMVKGKKFAEAEKKLQDLGKTMAPGSPERTKLEVTLAECQAETGKSNEAIALLTGIINKSTDGELKGLAYNTRAHCYQQSNRMEDALWDYLWVDVIYHQNRDEHAKAVFNLYKLFKDFKKDEAKAKMYKEKLEKDKAFATTEYQKMVLTDK